MTWLSDFAKTMTPDPTLEAVTAGWLLEVEVMRRGDDSDWRRWSRETRQGWAEAMLSVGADAGLLAKHTDATTWLRGVAGEAGALQDTHMDFDRLTTAAGVCSQSEVKEGIAS